MSPRQWQLCGLLCLLSLILPALAFHTQSHATVHQFLPPRLQGNQKHHHPLSLTPSESRLIYSTIFGVSRFHTMGFVGQFAQVLDLQRAWRQDDLFGQDLLGGAVVTVAGVVEEHEEALVGRKSAGNVLFRISESPNGRAFLDLMARMMGQRGDVGGEEVQRLYANTMGGEISVIPALEVQCLISVMGSGLLMYQAPVLLHKEPNVKMFTEKFGEAAAKLYDVSIREDRYFISEILALDSFLAKLDEIPLFPSQFIMVNLATLDVTPHYPTPPNRFTGNLPQTRPAFPTIPHRPKTLHASHLLPPTPPLNPAHRHPNLNSSHHHPPQPHLLSFNPRPRILLWPRTLLPRPLNLAKQSTQRLRRMS